MHSVGWFHRFRAFYLHLQARNEGGRFMMLYGPDRPDHESMVAYECVNKEEMNDSHCDLVGWI